MTLNRRQFMQCAGGGAVAAAMSSTYATLEPERTLPEKLSRRRWLHSTVASVPTGAWSSLINAVSSRASTEVVVAEPSADEWWLRTLLALVQKYRLNPLRAARCLAYTTVTLHDAGLRTQSIESASDEFAREIAASLVFSYMFPEEPRGRWSLDVLRRSRALRLSRDHALDGWQHGGGVARAVVDRALTDGSDPGGAAVQPPPSIVRPWKATPPLWMSRPIEPLASRWKPWLIDTVIADAVPPPRHYESELHRADVSEVLTIHRGLTSAQRQVAEQWDLDLGTVTPAGVWALKLLELPEYRRSPINERTAAISLLSVAMSDAFLACWKVKYRWWTERPITSIHRDIDASFKPHVVTPAHPSYVSGHATVSAAAAFILGRLYPESLAEFEAMAEEAALSRLFAGIHLRSDNEQGLALGRRVGAMALERALLATHLT